MAVTGHWIETVVRDTPQGPQYELKLRAELIGFHRVPGRHTGEHLAQALLYVLDRLSITNKVFVFSDANSPYTQPYLFMCRSVGLLWIMHPIMIL